jgi:hypothetical protein
LVHLRRERHGFLTKHLSESRAALFSDHASPPLSQSREGLARFAARLVHPAKSVKLNRFQMACPLNPIRLDFNQQKIWRVWASCPACRK